MKAYAKDIANRFSYTVLHRVNSNSGMTSFAIVYDPQKKFKNTPKEKGKYLAVVKSNPINYYEEGLCYATNSISAAMNYIDCMCAIADEDECDKI